MTGADLWRRDRARTRWVIGNWKMHGDASAVRSLAALETGGAPGVKVGVAVPHTLIGQASAAAGDVAIGAQDVHHMREGAHTGSVSAAMVRHAGAVFTIVGHGERRAGGGETAPVLREKIHRAVEAGLAVLLCCGEPSAAMAPGDAAAFVLHQLAEGLPERIDPTRLAIAYEPGWAIGKDVSPSNATLDGVLRAVRDWLGKRHHLADASTPILYGGAVDPARADLLFSGSSIDGVLIGRSSLSTATMNGIVATAARR